MRPWLFLLAFALFVAGAVALNLRSFNHFSVVEPVTLAQCEPVTGIAGPEDIEIDPKLARAFISSLDRRTAGARGAIHVFDLNEPLAASGFRDRTGGVPADFRPLGLNYFDDGAVRRLFVVNEAGPSVEIFDVQDDGELVHLETMKERRLMSPNNVVAVGARQFYVTNDVRGGREGLVADLSFILRLASGEVFFVDDGVWRLAAEGLRFANGVALSPDAEHLYVAETAGNRVRVYDRDPKSGALSQSRAIALPSSPDNITVDAHGGLWIGALPKPLLAPRLLKDATAIAPSEVLRINPGDDAISTIYRDDGGRHSASTVAARAKNKLLIGALYEQKFLYCELPPSSD